MSLFAKQALLLVVAAVVAVLSATSAGASVTVVNRLLTSESFQESSAHFRRLEPAFNFSLTHGVKHTRRRGLSEQIHQPYPDDLTVQFSSHGKVFKLTLSIAHHQVSDDARVVVETDDGQVILPHSLTSYTSTHLADHLNDVRAASVTILHHTAGADGGNVHGVFVDNDGVMYQIDPVEEHADYMEPEAYERLRRNAPHGLVVHRKLDTIGERAANAHCGNVDLPRGLRATRSKGRHLATADSADNGDPRGGQTASTTTTSPASSKSALALTRASTTRMAERPQKSKKRSKLLWQTQTPSTSTSSTYSSASLNGTS